MTRVGTPCCKCRVHGCALTTPLREDQRADRSGSRSRKKLGHADPAQDPTLDDEVNGFGFEQDLVDRVDAVQWRQFDSVRSSHERVSRP